MELDLSTFDLPTAVANAMTLIRERAQRHGIAMAQDVAPELGEVVADERKFKQILAQPAVQCGEIHAGRRATST